MRSDRGTKLLLAVIALGVWALTMTQLALPEAQARTGQTAQERQERREVVSTEPHAPISTRPLRWRIPWARHNIPASGGPACFTVVSVVNTGPTSTTVDVEFFNHEGLHQGWASSSIGTGVPDLYLTNIDTYLGPFPYDAYASTGTFDGYALVTADDPRIVVTAMMVCSKDGSDLLLTMNNIPAYPVGATADYFQAGMTATLTLPMATPE